MRAKNKCLLCHKKDDDENMPRYVYIIDGHTWTHRMHPWCLNIYFENDVNQYMTDVVVLAADYDIEEDLWQKTNGVCPVTGMMWLTTRMRATARRIQEAWNRQEKKNENRRKNKR